MTSRPKTSIHFNRENTIPKSLFSHPSITNLNIPSRSFPISPRMMNTTMRISAKDTILSTCSDAVMYCASQSPTIFANLADAHTPAKSEMMDMAWEIKPFLSPWMMAGIRQIKIMISKIFIYPKILYICGLKFSGNVPDCKNR